MMRHYVVTQQDHGLDSEPITARQVEIMFGPLEADDVVKVTGEVMLEALAAKEGLFRSRTQARKAGLWGHVPHGLHWFGTKKRRFWVWAPGCGGGVLAHQRPFDHTATWFGLRR